MPDLPVPNNSGDNLTTTFRHIEAYLYYLAQFGGGGGGGSGNVSTGVVLDANNIILGAGGTAIKDTATGSGVVTALGIGVGSAGAFVVNGGVLGTPSSGNLSNCTNLSLTTGVTGQLPTANIADGAIDSDKLAGDAVATGNIQANAVTYDKLPSQVDSTLLGRGDSGAGDTEVITIGSGLAMTGTTLSATGGGGTPGGNSTNIQYNDTGAFAGTDEFVFNNVTNQVTIGGVTAAGKLRLEWDGVANESIFQMVSASGGVASVLPPASASNFNYQFPSAGGTFALEANTATLTNKTINGSNNTITNVSLTTGVTGTLPLGNGGTGQTTAANAIQAFLDAISTTQGTILYNNGTDWVALSPGTADHFLQTKGAGQNPVWAAGGSGGSGILIQANETVDTTNRSTTSTSMVASGLECVLSNNLKDTASRVRIRVNCVAGASGTSLPLFTLFADDGVTPVDLTPSGCNCMTATFISANNTCAVVSYEFIHTPGVTTPLTYKLYFASDAGGTTIYIGRRGVDTFVDAPNIMTVEELD